MGHASQMQRSLNYTRGLIRRRNYYQHKAYDPTWGKQAGLEINKTPDSTKIINSDQNRVYLEKVKRKSRTGLLVGIFVAIFFLFIIVKFIF